MIQIFSKKNNLNYGILRYFNIAGSSLSEKIGLINKSDNLFKNFWPASVHLIGKDIWCHSGAEAKRRTKAMAYPEWVDGGEAVEEDHFEEIEEQLQAAVEFHRSIGTIGFL